MLEKLKIRHVKYEKSLSHSPNSAFVISIYMYYNQGIMKCKFLGCHVAINEIEKLTWWEVNQSVNEIELAYKVWFHHEWLPQII